MILNYLAAAMPGFSFLSLLQKLYLLSTIHEADPKKKRKFVLWK